MRAALIADQIAEERAARGTRLSRAQLCTAAEIIQAALETAQKNASRWHFIYRAGLGLAIDALKAYRGGNCRGVP